MKSWNSCLTRWWIWWMGTVLKWVVLERCRRFSRTWWRICQICRCFRATIRTRERKRSRAKILPQNRRSQAKRKSGRKRKTWNSWTTTARTSARRQRKARWMPSLDGIRKLNGLCRFCAAVPRTILAWLVSRVSEKLPLQRALPSGLLPDKFRFIWKASKFICWIWLLWWLEHSSVDSLKAGLRA